jgi:hypothetical protein
MATTTNYGWDTPDDTDLVKDGAAAIRTLGSSVDTTTKALNPSTTLGDIEYRSATADTNTRLGIGTTGQVLTVAGGVPSWATASAGGMTVIQSGSLSGTTTSLTSIPATYKDLQLVLRNAHLTPTSTAITLQLNSDTGSNYSYTLVNDSGTVIKVNSNTSWQLSPPFPNTSNDQASVVANFYDYTSTTNYKTSDSLASGGGTAITAFLCASWANSAAITSIQIKGGGQTLNGTYILYGVN